MRLVQLDHQATHRLMTSRLVEQRPEFKFEVRREDGTGSLIEKTMTHGAFEMGDPLLLPIRSELS